jgi:aryl-alcohol dehydrogenase-like predicted oxidoreductase
MELCLGTVQFGLDYGILGQKRKPLDYCLNCLDYATQNGVLTIDTAAAYGNAEEIVGIFLQKKTIARSKLFISSKMLPNVFDNYQPEQFYDIIYEHLTKQLKKLHTDYLDVYLLHSARYAFRADILETLARLKESGLVCKVGVSVYEPEEAKACIASPFVDFMQLPYSIFDHRMQTSGVFDIAKNNKIQIHSRSAFIQGLILLDETQVPDFLAKAKPIIRKIKEICIKTGLSRVQLAMAYVKNVDAISHLVFGVDTIEQLEENIKLFDVTLSPNQLGDIENEFENIDADIVMPSLWKR